MNAPTPINQTTFRILYLRYKSYTVPVVVLIVCFFIFIGFIIPQMQSWFSLQSDITAEQNKIVTLNQNLTFASKLDPITLTHNLALASNAIPQSKDFERVLNAVSDAAVLSNVSLGDYSFAVGDLSISTVNQSNLQIIVTINGGIADVQKYLLHLKSEFPLSEVTDVRVNPTASTLTVIFYYKTIGKISFDDTLPLLPLSKKENDLLKNLQMLQTIMLK